MRNHSWLVLGLMLLGLAGRLLPHQWNLTPLTAIALFGGTYLPMRWAIVLPLAIVAVSDLLLGWHTTIPFTWGAFAATTLLGWWIRQRPSASRILMSCLAGSLGFFIVTNFGVWLVGELYPLTAAGLWQCYVAAIPFFKNAVAGDLLYTTALFGLYAFVRARALVPTGSRSA